MTETPIDLGLMSEKQAEEMFEMMKNPPPLHPVLKPYLGTTAHFNVLRHPLVFAVPYTPAMNHHYNQCYEYKTKRLSEAKEKEEWHSYIFLHERPHRWDALLQIMNDMPDEDYWSSLGSIWSDTENLWQMQHLLPLFLGVVKTDRNKIMNTREAEFLESLPDEVRIFRGHQQRNKKGYSWSLSYWRARWFAQRWSSKKQGVLQGWVSKKDVIGVFLGRSEYEVAVDPDNVRDMKPVAKLKRPEWMQSILGDAWRRFKLSKVGSVHGLSHWDKVERNAIAICKLTKGADPLVCRLFAILHDAERLNEDDDPKHGYRAAGYVEKRLMDDKGLFDLKTVLDGTQIEKLLEAITYHNDGKVSEDPTIGACWDADRLDLSRVGIVPDPDLLSTEPARGLVWRV